MAGSIFWKERSIITLTSTGASLSSGTAGSAGTTLDCRSAGNAAEDMSASFTLQCQFTTVTGIAAGTVIAELYLVPAIDGTNYPDIDTTGGSSYIPFAMRKGSFTASKAMSSNTNQLFQSGDVDLLPLLYTVYILCKAGQTMSANWTLKVVTAQMQYS